ncbi:prolyl oligopeptidase family serine peptidase [Nocardiopsis sp. RSe5-2]|uniref:prolyl oligopeptidase n=1 Tax=Nocardiopsis endophytica TaxID=3018445 RepID=A0ABT4U6F8_9ACTN|nr:prolyl oligopeptidase family serine peptidase [Nocardiopsis endophytica]MDA2812533.1 prolyl oligopeptidase family serine peptidase [Nocardiopsis endophytica]
MTGAPQAASPVVPPPDPHRWLEDGADPAVGAWEAGQAALLDRSLGRDGLRDSVRRALAPYLEVGGYTAAGWHGGRVLYLRHAPDRDLPVLASAEAAGPQEDASARTVFDPAVWDPSGDTVLTGWSAAPGGGPVAVTLVSAAGGDGRVLVLPPGGGDPLGPPLTGCHPAAPSWLPDGSGFAYIREARDGGRLRRWAALHRLGAPQEQDADVAAGAADWTAQRTQVDPSGRWLLVQTRGAKGTAVWVGGLPDGARRAPGMAAVHAAPACSARFRRAGVLDVLTEHRAPRGRLLSARLGEEHRWEEAVAERPDAHLVDAVALGGTPEAPLLTVWREDGSSRIRLHGGDGEDGPGREVPLPGIGTVAAVAPGPDGREALIEWTDFTTPPSLLLLRPDGGSGDGGSWKGGAVRTALTAPGAARPGTVRCERLRATAPDGARIGVFVIGPPEDAGPAPTLLTVYGGFGLTLTPSFSAAALAWAAAGGRWAMAAVRGGGEEGSAWREAARGRDKHRSVGDLHATADHLVAEGVAERGRIALLGSSHGGMLAAAAAVDRPSGYAAAVCTAAPLDMARFPRWAAGRAWIPEYGDPDDPEDLAALLRYSPLHNVRDGTAYPPMLLTAFELDLRVDPAHARKFCAALQAAAHSARKGPAGRPGEQDGPEDPGALYALRPSLGHTTGAAAARKAQAGDEFAFLSRALGLPEPPPKP